MTGRTVKFFQHHRGAIKMLTSSILIPTKNGAPWIDACLRGIYAQQGVSELDVVIADSGSTDGTLTIASKYPVRIARTNSIMPEPGTLLPHWPALPF
jgi:glycosyltransferase involved in cell wall biosynthesis